MSTTTIHSYIQVSWAWYVNSYKSLLIPVATNLCSKSLYLFSFSPAESRYASFCLLEKEWVSNTSKLPQEDLLKYGVIRQKASNNLNINILRISCIITHLRKSF